MANPNPGFIGMPNPNVNPLGLFGGGRQNFGSIPLNPVCPLPPRPQITRARKIIAFETETESADFILKADYDTFRLPETAVLSSLMFLAEMQIAG